MGFGQVMLSVLLFVLLGLSVACAVFWLVVIERVVRTRLTIPTGARGLRLAAERAGPMPRVLLVVPAHNEAGVIADLIRSLKAQDSPNLRVLLALDRCTDDTEGVARRAIGSDARFSIHTIDACPDGWAGKVHAVHSAVSASADYEDAEFVCFTDADCAFHPAAVRASIALLEHRRLDMLSLLSRLKTLAWYEWVAQPAAVFELIRQYPLARVNREDERQRAFANGQFMLFRAEAYRAVGGHEGVKHELLEDIAFAREIKKAGLRGGLLAAGPLVSCRMYASWRAFGRGWKRIYTEAANRKARRLRRSAWQLRLVGALLPLCAVLAALVAVPLSRATGASPSDTAAALVIALSANAVWVLSVGLVLLSGSLPVLAAPLFPIGAVLVGGILNAAARDLERGAPTEWGGKRYARENRSVRAEQGAKVEAGSAR